MMTRSSFVIALALAASLACAGCKAKHGSGSGTGTAAASGTGTAAASGSAATAGSGSGSASGSGGHAATAGNGSGSGSAAAPGADQPAKAKKPVAPGPLLERLLGAIKLKADQRKKLEALAKTYKDKPASAATQKALGAAVAKILDENQVAAYQLIVEEMGGK